MVYFTAKRVPQASQAGCSFREMFSRTGPPRFYAKGLVGAQEYAVGRRPAGTEYGYHIVGKFSDKEGTGKRVEGRPCDVTFAKKQ
jgi:hypothetical protein